MVDKVHLDRWPPGASPELSSEQKSFVEPPTLAEVPLEEERLGLWYRRKRGIEGEGELKLCK